MFNQLVAVHGLFFHHSGSSFERAPNTQPLGKDPSKGNYIASSVEQESPYQLTYGERGTRVAIIASEPITDVRAK